MSACLSISLYGEEGKEVRERERERNSPGRSSAPRMLPCARTSLPGQRGVRIRCCKQQGAEHEGLILNNKGQEHEGLSGESSGSGYAQGAAGNVSR
jgi:hypothetical protein